MSVFLLPAISSVLQHPHKLEGADLVVMPYFDFLQPIQSVTPQDSEVGSQDMAESNSEDLIDMETNPATLDSANSQSSANTAPEPLATPEPIEDVAEQVMDDQQEEEDKLSSHIAITEPVKLALFQLGTFQQDMTEKAHPNVTIQIRDNGVYIEGTDRQTFEQIEHSISDYFDKMIEAHFTLEKENAQFLARKDVKERLLQTVNQTESPTMYTVSDCDIVVTSLSQDSANQACRFLKSQVSHFSMPVDPQYEGIFYCREWSQFLKALGFSSVKVSERGGNIDVLTLKGMESEKRTAILEFLSTPIERETVLSMEPGMLKYIQIHCHQLLADMDQVSIFPLEEEHVCGLKVCITSVSHVEAEIINCRPLFKLLFKSFLVLF